MLAPRMFEYSLQHKEGYGYMPCYKNGIVHWAAFWEQAGKGPQKMISRLKSSPIQFFTTIYTVAGSITWYLRFVIRLEFLANCNENGILDVYMISGQNGLLSQPMCTTVYSTSVLNAISSAYYNMRINVQVSRYYILQRGELRRTQRFSSIIKRLISVAVIEIRNIINFSICFINGMCFI